MHPKGGRQNVCLLNRASGRCQPRGPLTTRSTGSHQQRESRFEKFAVTQAPGEGIEGAVRKPDKTTDEKLGASMKNTRSDAVAGGLSGVSTTFPKQINLAAHRAKMRLGTLESVQFRTNSRPTKSRGNQKTANIRVSGRWRSRLRARIPYRGPVSMHRMRLPNFV
jgi:hypothetical protein